MKLAWNSQSKLYNLWEKEKWATINSFKIFSENIFRTEDPWSKRRAFIGCNITREEMLPKEVIHIGDGIIQVSKPEYLNKIFVDGDIEQHYEVEAKPFAR